jgi:hypothetical protein
MVCSLKFFCDFMEAKSEQRRSSLIKTYKKGSTGPAKGMMIYYKPALQLMRGRLCPDGTLEQKLAALRTACISAKWPEKLNDARIAANTLAYRAFRDEFGNKKLEIFSSPRLQYIATTEVAVNLQAELYASVDGALMMWKFGLSKKSPSEETIRIILQMMAQAIKHKGLALSITQVRFFDLRSGSIYMESVLDPALAKKLGPTAKAIAEAWERAA